MKEEKKRLEAGDARDTGPWPSGKKVDLACVGTD